MDDLPIIILSLIGSAFFSGMEIAFVSSNQLRLEVDKKKKSFLASISSFFHKHPEQFIATLLVGNNIALVIFGLQMAKVLEPFIAQYIQIESFILLTQTVISTITILVIAEFLPKIIFQVSPHSSLKFFAIPLIVCYFILFPIAWFATFLSGAILKLFNIKVQSKKGTALFNTIDLSDLVEESYVRGDIGEEIENDIKIFQNALDFSNIKLKNCIVPRTELTALDQESSLEELKQEFIESGFSKIIIYKDSIDHIIGYIHASQMFDQPESLKDLINEIPFVPETMAANKLLSFFNKEQKTMAVVVDEFGGTSGIVTIEDIIEEIFGEIEDEFDTEAYTALQEEDGSYTLSGRLEIDFINEKFNLDLPVTDDFETIAGYILFHLRKFPKRNETFELDQFFVKIIAATKNKIELVQLTPKEEKNDKQ